MPSSLLSICVGGAVGSGARFLLSSWATRLGPLGFPTGTLIVNLLGSLVIGVVMQLSLKTTLVAEDLRLFLVVGVLGGFTTFSSFSYESLALYQRGAHGLALLNVGAMVVGSLAATALGMVLTERFIRLATSA